MELHVKKKQLFNQVAFSNVGTTKVWITKYEQCCEWSENANESDLFCHVYKIESKLN